MTLSEITRADLEMIAHCNETTSNERLSELTSKAAISALEQFAQKQLASSQIEKDFYAKFESGLTAWKRQAAKIERACKENKILIANLKFHGFDVDEHFKGVHFEGDIEIFQNKLQSVRFFLLLYCAKQNLKMTCDLIDAFHFSDLDTVVKEVAQIDASLAIGLITTLKIEDPQALSVLRDLCAHTDPLTTLKNLVAFDEFDLDYRTWLAKLCIEKDPIAAAEALAILPLPQEIKESLYLEALKKNPFTLRYLPQELVPFHLTPFHGTQGRELALVTHLLSPMLKSIRTFLEARQIGASPLFLERLDPIRQHPHESEAEYKKRQVEQMVWVQSVGASLTLLSRHLSKQRLEDFLQSDILFSLADLPGTHLHWPIMLQIVELGKTKEISYPQVFKNAWNQIFSVFIQFSFCDEVKDLLIKASQSKFYKDGKNQHCLLELLLRLSESTTIDEASKKQLLKKMCEPLEKPHFTNTDVASFGQNVYRALGLVTMNIPAICNAKTPLSRRATEGLFSLPDSGQ